MIDAAKGPNPSDFELKSVTVKLSSGKEVLVQEMTLRQRDIVTMQLQDLASDSDIRKIVEPMLSTKNAVDDGATTDVEIDVISLIRAVSARIGDGALTRLLSAAVLNTPENRPLFGTLTPEEWALDGIRLSDETRMFDAFKSCNDLGKYLGNLMGLLSLGVEVRKAAVAEAAEA